MLAGDERGATGGAALLAVVIGELHALPGNAVDVRGAVTHQAVGVGADVRLADVVAPDDHDVGLLLGLSGTRVRRCQARRCQRHQRRAVRPIRAAPGGCRRTGWAGRCGDGSLRGCGRHGFSRGDWHRRSDISQARAEPEDGQGSESRSLHDAVAPGESTSSRSGSIVIAELIDKLKALVPGNPDRNCPYGLASGHVGPRSCSGCDPVHTAF